MIFEFDENKSKINKEKHGIDFIEAQKLFFLSHNKMKKVKTIDNEFRYSISGFIDKKCWTCIFDKIRIISVRRCRDKEKKEL